MARWVPWQWQVVRGERVVVALLTEDIEAPDKRAARTIAERRTGVTFDGVHADIQSRLAFDLEREETNALRQQQRKPFNANAHAQHIRGK